ncbi:MAG: GNAT family N-acetyltransferase [Flavobacteriaceae bacterium]
MKCDFDTPRLQARALVNRIEDDKFLNHLAAKILEILSPSVTKTLPDGWQNILTIEQGRTWILERNQESHFITVELIESKELIGFIFLYEPDKQQHEDLELRFGYLISEHFWGRGLGTELVQGLIHWSKAQEGFSSISAGVEKENIASIKVMEKAGFISSKEETPDPGVVFYQKILK